MTFAIFKLSGYMPVWIDKLKSFTSAGAKIEEDSLTNFVVKSSYPVELLFLRLQIALLISSTVISWKNKECWTGFPRYFFNSELLFCENLLARLLPISLKKLLTELEIAWGSFRFNPLIFRLTSLLCLILLLLRILPNVFQRILLLLLWLLMIFCNVILQPFW